MAIISVQLSPSYFGIIKGSRPPYLVFSFFIHNISISASSFIEIVMLSPFNNWILAISPQNPSVADFNQPTPTSKYLHLSALPVSAIPYSFICSCHYFFFFSDSSSEHCFNSWNLAVQTSLAVHISSSYFNSLSKPPGIMCSTPSKAKNSRSHTVWDQTLSWRKHSFLVRLFCAITSMSSRWYATF